MPSKPRPGRRPQTTAMPAVLSASAVSSSSSVSPALSTSTTSSPSPPLRPLAPRQPGKSAQKPGGHSRHGSSASTASSNGTPGTPGTATPTGRPKRVAYALLRWDDLPAWRRDNAFIRSGYRPTSHSYMASLGSVLGLHNESVNIWTHLAGAVVAAVLALLLHVDVGAGVRARVAALLAALPGAQAAVQAALRAVGATAFAEARAAAAAGSGSGSGFGSGAVPSTLALSCFAAGAVACLGMSATYHALSNHSPAVARWGNKLDYSGIVLLIVGSYVPTLHYGFFCHPRWRAAYLQLIVLLALACLAVAWLDRFRTPAWRPVRALLFVGLGASGVVPVAHSLLLLEDAASLAARYRQLDARIGLGCVLLEGALYVAGAALYAARWPERWRPGRFDTWGSSHQLFHVAVLLAAAAHLRAVLAAHHYHHTVLRGQCPA